MLALGILHELVKKAGIPNYLKLFLQFKGSTC
jgi:hypothetical protein